MKLPRLSRSRRQSRPDPAQAALTEFEDVAPGEGGEPETPATSDIDTDYDIDTIDPAASERGSTGGTGTLNLEVALLSIAAVDTIAAEIARKVATAAGAASGIKGVVLASPDLLAVLRLRASLVGELEALDASVEAAAAAPETEDVDAAALAVPAAALAVQGLKRVAQSASSALSVFAVTTQYSGRKETVRQVVLDAALAKYLARHGLSVRIPAYALPKPAENGFIARALRLQLKCREAIAAGTAGPQVSAAGQAVDAIVAAVFGASIDRPADPAAKLAQQLMLADSIAAAGEEGYAALFAELTVTGGSYRTRRWLFNFLTGSDGLSYSGGAAATFFLFRADQQSALASDTIYYASAHERFEQPRRRHRATNIESPDIEQKE